MSIIYKKDMTYYELPVQLIYKSDIGLNKKGDVIDGYKNSYGEIYGIRDDTQIFSIEDEQLKNFDIKELYNIEQLEGFLGFKEYYEQNPAAFVENYLGIELKEYQKIFLKYLGKKKRSRKCKH